MILAIQCVCITGILIESVIVLRRWKEQLHVYLFISCIALLINEIGYLLELNTQTVDAYLTALKFSYLGREWYAFFMFLFVAQLTQKKLPVILRDVMILFGCIVYVSILLTPGNSLYYKNIGFDAGGTFPKFIHGNGILHHLNMAMQILYIVMGIAWLVIAYRGEKNKLAKRRLNTVLLAIMAESAFFIVQIVGIPGLTDLYDITMLGYFISTIIMYIAIFSCDLLGTRELAREFIIDRISEGIIAVDNEGVVQYINAPAKELYTEPGSDISEDKDTLSQRDFLAEIRQAIEDNRSIALNDRIYTPEENDLLHRGEKVGKIYALVDDTEHYRYMEELQRQKEIADSANASKSRFLANMSHEIRTPINAVLGFDEMILRESTEKAIRSYAADIQASGRTLLSLINDILDLSKVEEGKMEIIPVQYELSSLINDLSGMIRDRAAKKGLKFNIQVDEHTPHLLIGDEIRVRQCVLNLLTNAVKYTNEGSVSLSVTFEKKNDAAILLSFMVKDTGIGMKKEDMEKLFSPCQRIEEKRNRAIEGTGLGMSIVKQLLDLMGSKLQVESEYGKGTEISFVVEQGIVKWEEIGRFTDRFNEIRNGEHSYHELFHAPDARILVVDDTEMNLTVITSLLKKTQIQIDTALSGKDAIVLTAENHYDVVFIDHMMPDMDGMETLKHIRETGRNADTPAVALTANAVSGAREMYLDAGFTDYLSKPVDGDRLERLLKDFIPEEKIIEPDDEAEPIEKEEPESMKTQIEGMPEWLLKIPFIDAKKGFKNCGSVEGYLSVLEVFHQTAASKANEIENHYRGKDIANYTIKVHALKSSARIIGADDLSDLAGKMEQAGKEGRFVEIEEKTGQLLEMYRALDEKLSVFFRKEIELQDIGNRELMEAYQTIGEIARSMDYGLMEDLLKSLEGYPIPEEEEKILHKVRDCLMQLDWDGISKILEAHGKI